MPNAEHWKPRWAEACAGTCDGKRVVIAGDAVMTRDFWRERRGYYKSVDLELAGMGDISLPWLANSAERNRPNILFAIADDWGLHASAYGTRWVKTPAFDRVAREGILFYNAYTPNAKCAPSRACLLTGRNSRQLKAAANHISYFPPEFKGWGEALAEQGWFVGHTQKGWGPGVATNLDGRPRQMTGQRFNARTAKPPTTGISNNDYAANFDDFLEAAPTHAPWCF